ncbi:MAG TPA: VWA domain-containing protein [Vicinamibacterales bacterium]|nr:VWA domain-containing protein [Vicinamibacterales bacterium]
MMLRVVTVLALLAGTGAQPSPLQLQIVSPPDGSYVSDRLTIEARILPRERRNEIADITFYADGKLICRSTNIQLPRCEWDAGALIKPHQIRVVATTTSGERIVATSRTRAVDFNESAEVRVVQVNASVIDRDGKFVAGLLPKQFRVREDGKPQVIQHFAAEEAPLEIVVAMDISGSMGVAIDDLKVAVRQFLAKLRPSDAVTLVAFNQDMFVLTRRETSPEVRSKAIDRLTAWGGTTLYDVIIRSLDLLSRQPGRRSLVVFSDGEDQSSQASFAVVDRALKATDATLFMVGLGRGRQEANLRETLEALAEPTGGRALFADRPSELGRTFAELLNELTHQYLLGYESTNTARNGAWRKVEVDIPGTSYRVRARQGYFAPAK